jgi:hypothetical protein
MLRILFYGFLIYLLYQLVFNFIVPVYRSTRQIRKGFQKMHEQMNEKQQQQTSSNTTDQKSNTKVGEYIDFEEIK